MQASERNVVHHSAYQTRRVVGHLEEGEELIAALTRLCVQEKILAGELRACGALSGAEIVHLDPTSRQYQITHSTEDEVEIVHLRGDISQLDAHPILRVDVVLSARGPFGAQLVAGHLRSGRARSVEFVLDVYEDLVLERSLDAQSGRLRISQITPREVVQRPPQPASAPTPEPVVTPRAAAEAPEPAQATMSWDAAVAAADEAAKPASQRQRAQAMTYERQIPTSAKALNTPAVSLAHDTDELPELRPGDVLDHPKLKRCRVMRVEDDYMAHIRLPTGKTSKLLLDIFDIVFVGEEEGRRVFRLRLRETS